MNSKHDKNITDTQYYWTIFAIAFGITFMQVRFDVPGALWDLEFLRNLALYLIANLTIAAFMAILAGTFFNES
jgi:hypothetical protein